MFCDGLIPWQGNVTFNLKDLFSKSRQSYFLPVVLFLTKVFCSRIDTEHKRFYSRVGFKGYCLQHLGSQHCMHGQHRAFEVFPRVFPRKV